MNELNDTKTNLGVSSVLANQSQVHRAIISTALKETSKAAYYRRCLVHIAGLLNCPYAVIYVRQSSEVVEDYYHSGPNDPGFYQDMVQKFLTDVLAAGKTRLRMYRSKFSQDNVALALLSSPIYNTHGATIGAIAMAVNAKSKGQAQLFQITLESLTIMMSYCAELVGNHNANQHLESAISYKQLCQVAGYSSRHELAFSLANNLRNKSNCDQVILGLVSHKKVKIIAISGLDDVQKQSASVKAIREAMEECLDLDRILAFQPKKRQSNELTANDYRLHRQWHNIAGNAAVASIPLHTQTGCAAIVSLRRDSHCSFTKEELDKIRDLMEPFAPAFALIDRAQRNLLTHAMETTRQTATNALKPQRWKKKMLVVALLAFLGWFCFGTTDYQITVPATIVPAQVRHIAAPFTGMLQSAPVVQGDLIEQAGVLCVFDHQELSKEREKLIAQIEIAQLEEDKALTTQSQMNVQLARAHKRMLQAKLDIVNQKIDQATMRAPFDGIVVRGDMRSRIGQIIPQGEPLFEISSSKQWQLEMAVPEHLSLGLSPGLTGKFATNAQPELLHNLQVSRVSPHAELRQGKNVYLTEAPIDADLPWIKSGMEGMAKINLGRKRVCWVALHNVIDYFRMKFWL